MSSTEAKNISAIVDEVFENYKNYSPLEGVLIPFLQDVQARIGYLPEPAMKRAATLLKMSGSRVLGVATFYHQFRLKPKAKHIITVCRGTACHVGGSKEIYDFLIDHLDITPPEDTSDDGFFLVQQVRCIGACALAPIMKVDDEVFGKMNPTRLMGIVAKYRRLEEKKI
ncbi:MAG: NAD(P)H-dependent oxidoreductase subunit E [Candidatus Bathyarchaeota archaeon]